MKKLALALAFALAAAGAQAESVTITHATAGGFADELAACGTEAANITELTITGDAVMDKNDFKALRTSLAATLTKLDLSNAKFTNNRFPGEESVGGTTAGVLENMTALVECKVPETLTGFMAKAFAGCTELTTVNMPDGITVIHQQAFQNCGKLNLANLPSALTAVRANAFEKCTALTVSELPLEVKTIMGRGFYQSGVTFTELPEGVTTIAEYAFAGSKVQFKTIPSTVTTFGTYVFQSVKTMPEFTIPDVAGLWTKIPDATFWVDPNTFERTFICRAPEAPQARFGKFKGDWSDEWGGVFGKGNNNQTFPNITFKVLASALSSYQATGPYKDMKLEILKTALAEPVVEKPTDVLDEHYTIAFEVNGETYTDFSAIPEGQVNLKIEFADDADDAIYVDEINYAEPVAYAEGEEGGDVSEEPTYIYKAANPAEVQKQAVTVPVTITPGMSAFSIKLAKYSDQTGIGNIAADKAGYERRGDVIYLTNGSAALYNVAGALVATASANTIDMSALPAGLYILRTGKTAAKIVK